MLWFFRLPHFPQIVSIYRALEVWAINLRLHCGSPKFWPRLHSLSLPGSFIKTNFSFFIVGLCCSMQSSVATCSLCSILNSVAIEFPWLRQYSFLQHIHSVMIEFHLSRQIILWLLNNLSCKVCRSNRSVS